MKIYHKFAEVLYIILKWITAIVVLAMLCLMLIEVVRRYIFNVTWPWSDEVIRYLLIYCTFFGGACAYYKKGLVAFTLIYDKLSKKIQAALMIINNTVLLAFFVFLVRWAVSKTFSRSVVNYVSTSSGLSGAVPYIAILAGLIFLVIFTIDFYPELIRNFINERNKSMIREGADK